jgi:hypothetical protein
MGHNVKRRWSEFQWLRDSLAKAYAGLFVPTLPTNSVVLGATDVEGELVKSRIVLLTAFMNGLFTIPFLLGDSLISNFLSLDDKDFKAFQDSLSKSGTGDNSSPGAVAWRNMLEAANPQLIGDMFFEDLKKYLDSLKAAFVGLNDQCTACLKNSQLLYSEMSQTTTAFGAWADAECCTTDSLPPEAVSLRAPNIKKTSDALVVCAGHWTVSTHGYIKMYNAVSSIIQDQLVQVGGLSYDHVCVSAIQVGNSIGRRL